MVAPTPVCTPSPQCLCSLLVSNHLTCCSDKSGVQAAAALGFPEVAEPCIIKANICHLNFSTAPTLARVPSCSPELLQGLLTGPPLLLLPPRLFSLQCPEGSSYNQVRSYPSSAQNCPVAQLSQTKSPSLPRGPQSPPGSGLANLTPHTSFYNHPSGTLQPHCLCTALSLCLECSCFSHTMYGPLFHFT